MSYSSTAQKLEEFRKRKLVEKEEIEAEQISEELQSQVPEEVKVSKNESEENILTVPNWMLGVIFVFGQAFAAWIQFGMVFFIAFLLVFIYFNTGKRKTGEISAYSVFNEQCERLPGQMTAEHFERDVLQQRRA